MRNLWRVIFMTVLLAVTFTAWAEPEQNAGTAGVSEADKEKAESKARDGAQGNPEVETPPKDLCVTKPNGEEVCDKAQR